MPWNESELRDCLNCNETFVTQGYKLRVTCSFRCRQAINGKKCPGRPVGVYSYALGTLAKLKKREKKPKQRKVRYKIKKLKAIKITKYS